MFSCFFFSRPLKRKSPVLKKPATAVKRKREEPAVEGLHDTLLSPYPSLAPLASCFNWLFIVIFRDHIWPHKRCHEERNSIGETQEGTYMK